MHSPGRGISSELGASADATHRRKGSSGSVAAALHSHRRRADCSTPSASTSSAAPRQGARRGSGHLRERDRELRNQKEQAEQASVLTNAPLFSFLALRQRKREETKKTSAADLRPS